MNTPSRKLAAIPFARVSLTTDENGLPDKPVIDGREVDHVKSAAVFLAPGRIPTVALEVVAGRVEFDGEAEIVFFDEELPADRQGVLPGHVLVSEECLSDLVERAGLAVEFDGTGGAVISTKEVA